MKRDRKFAKNRKCNDPMNFKGGSTRRSFDDGSRLWKLFPEQLEITRLLAVKRCSTINSLISKSRIPNYEYVKFKRVFFRFVRRDRWKEVREKYPLSCFSIVDSREKFQTHPRFDSQRVSRFSPRQNDPPFAPRLLPQLPPIRGFETRFPRVQRDFVSGTSFPDTRTLPSISICKSLGEKDLHRIREYSLQLNATTIISPLFYFISFPISINSLLAFDFYFIRAQALLECVTKKRSNDLCEIFMDSSVRLRSKGNDF